MSITHVIYIYIYVYHMMAHMMMAHMLTSHDGTHAFDGGKHAEAGANKKKNIENKK